MDTITLIGLVAGLLTTFSFLPQIIKIIKTKDVKSISLWMTLIYSGGVVLWLIYGFYINNIVLLITNSFSLLFGLIMVYLKLKYKNNKQLNFCDLFKDSKPMGGLEYEILCETFKRTTKNKPTLPNRK